MKRKAVLTLFLIISISFYALSQNIQKITFSTFEIGSNESILKNTEDSQNHTTLLSAIRAAELEEILSYDGPFTVFAPSDTAFEKLPKSVVADLLDPQNKQELQSLMTYHIIAGEFSTSKILKAMCRGEGSATFTTVNGDELVATIDGVDIVLSDKFGNKAKITEADSNQCNGVIHEIDTVIRPSK